MMLRCLQLNLLTARRLSLQVGRSACVTLKYFPMKKSARGEIITELICFSFVKPQLYDSPRKVSPA